jgi:hypothetical protein
MVRIIVGPSHRERLLFMCVLLPLSADEIVTWIRVDSGGRPLTVSGSKTYARAAMRA